MNPWFEALGVSLIAAVGVGLGRWFSRLPRPYWLIGYVVPLTLILAYILAHRVPALSLIPPFSWLVLGRNKFASMGFVATMVLTTPLSRIRPPRARLLISLLMALIVIQSSVWPFLAPAFNHNYLASLRTRIDSDGVCRQSNDYNCGPAAAVTALRRLGFPAEEGEIAILAHTSSAIGTPPDVLARALQERYGHEGLVSEYRVFRNLGELRQAGLVLAVIRYSFWMDHYVTVLEVTDREVIAGDPSLGLVRFSKESFLSRWRFVGVVLSRKTGLIVEGVRPRSS
jgi:peptidase C39-like protein